MEDVIAGVSRGVEFFHCERSAVHWGGEPTPCRNLVCKEWDVTIVEMAAMLRDISHDGKLPLAYGEGPIIVVEE